MRGAKTVRDEHLAWMLLSRESSRKFPSEREMKAGKAVGYSKASTPTFRGHIQPTPAQVILETRLFKDGTTYPLCFTDTKVYWPYSPILKGFKIMDKKTRRGGKKRYVVYLFSCLLLFAPSCFELQLVLRRAVLAYRQVSRYIRLHPVTLVIAYCALKCF